MRSLPRQTVHLPFEANPFRMAMDLVTVPKSAWLELDEHYPEEMTERRHMLDNRRAEVFGAVDGSESARLEALAMVVSALTTYHPEWFSKDGNALRNDLTGELWPLQNATGMDPLELAGRLVQEDLCLVQDADGIPIFTAAVLCFPSRWRLMDKLGKPLAAVHGPVPFYADRLSRPVDRFMRHVKAGHIACRLNWSVLDDHALFQPGGKWRLGGDAGVTVHDVGDRLFLRVERQTLRRLPESDAVLFGIRVHVYPLFRVITDPDKAAALGGAVRVLPPEILHYKSVMPFREALLEWLDRRALSEEVR